MDINDIYELTLQQEVLNEKAATILADIINGRLKAKSEGDLALAMVWEDMLMQLSLLKPTITTAENLDQASLTRIDGQLNCLQSLCTRTMRRAA